MGDNFLELTMGENKRSMSKVLEIALSINTFIANTCPPGPRCLPWYLIINFQKGGTLPYCILLMHLYDNWSMPCLLYPGMHGSYGLVWLLKHLAFRDPKWDTKCTVMGSI